LSVQITLAAPSVSTASSLRTTAPRLAMRCMPSASVMVVMAGRPSGIAATAKLTASRSSSCQARPPFHIPQAKRSPLMPRQPQRIRCPKLSSLISSGVFSSPAPEISSPMRPSSVFGPVAVTTARPLPRTTVVPRKIIVPRSASGASSARGWRASLLLALLSPVSVASSAARSMV
jgi:hypothetical protein